MITIENRKSKIENLPGFTLIELLVVIFIIGLLAGLTFPVLSKMKEVQYKKVARAELVRLEAALEGYKAKYGVYPPGNQNQDSVYAPQGLNRSQFSQLYYELSGTTRNNSGFVTLDGLSQISINPANLVSKAYGVAGFINCTQGSGEEASNAKNFMPDLKPNGFSTFITNNGVPTAILVTSVGGPDEKYQPLKASGVNPFRYVYPGINNPNSYDLWVQLVIKGRTNLICNWSRQVQINSPLP